MVKVAASRSAWSRVPSMPQLASPSFHVVATSAGSPSSTHGANKLGSVSVARVFGNVAGTVGPGGSSTLALERLGYGLGREGTVNTPVAGDTLEFPLAAVFEE